MMKFLVTLSFLGASLSAQVTGSTGAFTDQANPPASQAADPSLNPVVQWNRELLVIVRTPGAQSPTIHPTRSFAIMHAAIYDAVNNIDRTHRPYLVQFAGVSHRASKAAALDAAAHAVL